MADRGKTTHGRFIIGEVRMEVEKLEEGNWWTLGSDCGEQRHRFVLEDENKNRKASMWVRNRAENIHTELINCLNLLPEGYRLEIVTEGLRSIGGILMQEASNLGLRMWQVNPKALEHYRILEGQPRKDDDRDADLLARMSINRIEGCRLAFDSLPEEKVLCRLTRIHSQLVRQRTMNMNQVRSRLLELSPEVVDKEWDGPSYNSVGLRAVLKRWPGFEGLERVRVNTIERVLKESSNQGSRCKKQAAALRKMAGHIPVGVEERTVITMELRMLLNQVGEIEGSLKEVDSTIKSSVEAHPIGKKLLEMPGIGHFTAGVLIGEILPLARNVSEGKAATYAGLTPLSRRSGKKDGPSRLARGINKHAARTLYLSAVSAICFSSIDHAYYHKQLNLHKGHPKAHVKSFISLARQRFKLMYKLLTTKARYDKETLISSHLKRRNQLEKSKTKTAY